MFSILSILSYQGIEKRCQSSRAPPTAIVITDWLEECESIFTEQDSESWKILLAGSALSEHRLAKWWRAERSKFQDPVPSWDDFIESLKTRALGRRVGEPKLLKHFISSNKIWMIILP